MDKKSLLWGTILGFALGVVGWFGDQVYGFRREQMTGVADFILHLFPWLDYSWFWNTLYWGSRISMFVIPVILIVLLWIEYAKDKKKVMITTSTNKLDAKKLNIKLNNANIDITFTKNKRENGERKTKHKVNNAPNKNQHE